MTVLFRQFAFIFTPWNTFRDDTVIRTAYSTHKINKEYCDPPKRRKLEPSSNPRRIVCRATLTAKEIKTKTRNNYHSLGGLPEYETSRTVDITEETTTEEKSTCDFTKSVSYGDIHDQDIIRTVDTNYSVSENEDSTKEGYSKEFGNASKNSDDCWVITSQTTQDEWETENIEANGEKTYESNYSGTGQYPDHRNIYCFSLVEWNLTDTYTEDYDYTKSIDSRNVTNPDIDNHVTGTMETTGKATTFHCWNTYWNGVPEPQDDYDTHTSTPGFIPSAFSYVQAPVLPPYLAQIPEVKTYDINVSIADSKKALKPCTWISGEARNCSITISVSGDAERTGDVTVYFELSGTAVCGNDHATGDYHLTRESVGGSQPIDVDNGLGFVVIPAGQDSLIIYVMPNGNYVFDNDKTVLFNILRAKDSNNCIINCNNTTDNITILQAPEFISGDDSTPPTTIYPDSYILYVDAKDNYTVSKGGTPVSAAGGSPSRPFHYAFCNSLNENSLISSNTNPLLIINKNNGSITALRAMTEAEIESPPTFTIKVYYKEYNDLYDLASLTIKLFNVDLDTDSDNNGYINSGKNPERQQAEDNIENTTAKRITYFEPNLVVPNDFAYVQLEIACTQGENDTYTYCFEADSCLEVYELNGTYQRVYPNTTYSSNDLSGKHDNFYVRAVGLGGMSNTVCLIIKANGVEIGRDTVKFAIQNNSNVSGWVIPSGWTINSDGSFTTPMPNENAIGPKTEGSGVTEHSGDAYYTLSDEQKANGFKLSFDFSFERNTTSGFPTGYLRPDCGSGNNQTRGDEVLTSDDLLKMSFFGNSGVKLFGKEIQIFDIVALWNAFNLCGSDVNNGILMPQTDEYGNVYQADVNKKNSNCYDVVDNFISGAFYNKNGSTSYSYTNLEYAKYICNLTGIQHMEINVSVSNGLYIITVLINGYNVFGGELSSKEDIQITDELSDKIYFQSHWGSGVTFANIEYD